MQASVVISYYKNIANLDLILLALNKQTAKGTFEVIIAEDDNAIETVNFINSKKHAFSFPLIHLWQKDDGFRKCKVLNKAIEASTTDFIIFIDGDCIPHRQLVKHYIQAKKTGRVLYGRRVMLSEKISRQLLHKKDLSILSFFKLLFRGCKRIEEGLYLPIVPQIFIRKASGRLLGCNMGICKKELMAINGFDEDYTAPGGGEDSDIEWRLQSLGTVSFYSIKFKAIVYHIYHPERFTKLMEIKNNTILENKIHQGFIVCKNGLKKLQ